MFTPGVYSLSITHFFLNWKYFLTIQSETAHSTFKMSERIHKFKISRKIGTPVHQEMALKSLVWHNSKRAGFVSPQDFRLRKSSPRVWGSPMSSPRLKMN